MTTSYSVNVGLGEEELDTIGEEEFTVVAESTTLPRSFLGTAVPPQLGVGNMLQSVAYPTTPAAAATEVLKCPTTSALARTKSPWASPRMSPRGFVTTDKGPHVYLLRLKS